jgi:hypothetical protein
MVQISRIDAEVGLNAISEIPEGEPKMAVMQHVWESLKLGTSLCHLFNMLLPNFSHDATPISIEFPDFDYEGPEGKGVYAWAREKDNLKKCKKGAANFIMRMTQLKKSGHWPEEDPLFTVMELLGESTESLKVVLNTVIRLLDRLPESAWIQDDENSPTTPYGASSIYGDNTPLSGSQDAFPPPLPFGHARNFSESHQGSSNGTLREMPSSATMSSQFQSLNGGSIRARQPLSINTSFDGKNFSRSHPSAGPMTSKTNDIGPMDAGPAAMSVWEILKTEKKYVSDLEVLQVSAEAERKIETRTETDFEY